jgi:DNA polymerase
VECEDFKILCIAYDFEGKQGVIDLVRDVMPEWLIRVILDPSIIKKAFNATFERICLSRHFGVKYISPIGWQCTNIQSARDGIIGNLAVVSKALGDVEKLSTGKELIKFFSIPKKDGSFNNPLEFKEKFNEFKHYCQVDVQAEKSIITHNGFDFDLYIESEKINDRGIKVNIALCKNAVINCEAYKNQTLEDLKELTCLVNPNSHVQFKKWLNEQGYPLESTNKETLKALSLQNLSPIVNKAIDLKLSLSATSVTKYQKMLDMVCEDGRVRGIHRMNGGATGRFSGQGIQGQNLPRGHIDEDKRKELIEGGTLTPDECKQLIRSAIEGDFLVADFSSIEALVLAWLVDDKDRLIAFKNGLDIYKVTATKIYNVAYEDVNKDQRQTAKIAELAFGYQGGVNAAIQFGAKKVLSDIEIEELVKKWRGNNPKIVNFWYGIQEAFKNVIKTKKAIAFGKLLVYYKQNNIYIRCPSGIDISYPSPQIVEGRFGETIAYTRVRKGQLVQEFTYGGKLVENITQAVAFHILRQAILNLKDYKIVMHVHDEIVVEKDKFWESLDDLIYEMTKKLPWAEDLPLKAEGFISNFYKK